MKLSYFLFILAVVLFEGGVANGQSSSPFFKVFCDNTPLVRCRVDPIVQPGIVANHVHKVFGGSAFDASSTTDTPIAQYGRMVNSKCTTCSITKDLSAYWVADLYYQYPDGSLTAIPNGGLTIYYLTRSGDGAQANPSFQAFPKGFRMTAGSAYNRNCTGTPSNQAFANWACLSTASPYPQVSYLPTQTEFCNDGLRAQIAFPQCWDGVNLDSPTHQSHVAYPIQQYDTGDCPDTHPVRLPFIFFELLYSVADFPHGDGSRQPFVLANGDSTGCGIHADFLNGWNVDVLQQALQDVSCFANNTNNGNNVSACNTLNPYVKTNNPDATCLLERPLSILEDTGLNHNISHLPGCMPITGFGPTASECKGSIPQDSSFFLPLYRVLIQSAKNQLFVTASNSTTAMTASVPMAQVGGTEVFLLAPITGGYSIQTEFNLNFVSAQRDSAALMPSRNSPSTWETYVFNYTGGSGPTGTGTPATILSLSDNQYITLQSDGSVWATASATSDAGTGWIIYDADALAAQMNYSTYVVTFSSNTSTTANTGTTSLAVSALSAVSYLMVMLSCVVTVLML